MSFAGTDRALHAGPDAHAEADAEALALIEEARALARRRRQIRIAVAVVCAPVLVAGTLAAIVGFSGSRAVAGAPTGSASAVIGSAGLPRYFLSAQQSLDESYGWLQVRESATGKVVAQPRDDLPDYDPPYGLAVTGPRSFVVGIMTPSDCATQFFRLQLDDQGRPGALTRVGPTLPGTLTAMASSSTGLIGYAIDDSGCKTGGTSLGIYLGVLNLQSGRTRQWTQATRISHLSMSANGRLLAFTHATGRPIQGGGMTITGMQVQVLPVDAPTGTVAERSRVVARTPPDDSPTGDTAVLLSPSGSSFYLCSQPFTFPQPGPIRFPIQQSRATTVVQTAQIVAYRTATGKPTGVIATFTESYVTPGGVSYYAPTVSCSSMALDPSGRYLLVPYDVTPLNFAADNSGARVSAALIDTATGARSDWTLRFDDAPASMTIAW